METFPNNLTEIRIILACTVQQIYTTLLKTLLGCLEKETKMSTKWWQNTESFPKSYMIGTSDICKFFQNNKNKKQKEEIILQ